MRINCHPSSLILGVSLPARNVANMNAAHSYLNYFYRFSTMTVALTRIWVVVLLLGLGGCQSLMTESASVVAGLGGAAVAQKVTDNAAVTAGIGIGFQAATRSAVQYALRNSHGKTQQAIALAAAPLNEGQVAAWYSTHTIPLEPDERGRVTVSRSISDGLMQCKEIVYSVDTMVKTDSEVAATSTSAPSYAVTDDLDAWVAMRTPIASPKNVAHSQFYVASICQSPTGWVWATAEPAVSRWGALQ